MLKTKTKAQLKNEETVTIADDATTPNHKNKSVGKLAKEGVFYTVLARLGNTFTQMLGSIFLARLLEPTDFGILQYGWLVIGFATKFGEFGFNMSLIQRNTQVQPKDVNTLFVLDLFFKVTLWVIVLISTPYIAAFFKEPILKIFLPVFSFYIVLECFSTSPVTMLQRDMNFKAYSQVLAIDRTVQLAGALTFAALGYGVWSLVIGEFCGLIWSSWRAIQLSGWRPKLQFDLETSKELFGYGNWVFLRNLFRYLSDNVDYLIIGRVLDAQQLGYYTKAFELMKTPRKRITRALSSVVFPAFARVQDQPERVRRGFQKLVLSVSLVAYPIQVTMLMAAPAFIYVVLGEKWAPTITCVQIMCVAGILRALDPFLNSVITTSGFVKRTALRRVIEFAILAVAVGIGVKWGINGVSTAVTITSIIVMVLMINLIRRVSLIGWREYLTPQWPAIVGSVFMAAAMWVVNVSLEKYLGRYSLGMLLVSTITGLIAYAGILLVWRPKRVVDLYQELSEDAQGVIAKGREKIAGWKKRFGLQKETSPAA